ncbi:hypothetical protein F3Y22_tig00111394pilonHSYRG00011 [Hibiscus syriacus]|uniref:Outer arm dynein light chain 1 protein n=1 Tax=Hibiscus syriacus TaxID=106335 RepID=A0A6A2YLH5_HIBSY|nr:hypothetical protein F3Y22_tig00111394pilonHSYRG00011 [Hibiscus syriacus]
MVTFTCFPLLKSKSNKKKKGKGVDAAPKAVEQKEEERDLQKGIEEQVQPFESDEPNSKSFDIFREESLCNAKVISPESPLGFVESEAYEGEDEHEDASTSRRFSDFEFQAHVISSGESFDFRTKRVVSSDSFEIDTEEVFIYLDENDDENVVDMIESAHVCDPGIQRTEFCALPILKRSCSNLETRNVQRMVVDQFLRKSWSFEELHELSARATDYFNAGSPASEMTCCSTNAVEPDQALNVGEMKSPGLHIGESSNKDFIGKCNDNRSWKAFHNGVTSSLWLQNQWFAFPSSSPSLARVDEWVRGLDVETTQPADDMNGLVGSTFPFTVGTCKSPAMNRPHSNLRSDRIPSKEVLYTNDVIQTLIQVTPGSLPKGIHTLNLSKNKINNIEGLRELTRLRVIDLSYNRIARIGHGLSNCTLIKELYLAGNKISDVEGLHRLLKLTVLDLSFNKMSTTKALGQLAANYNTLQALNLLGNPFLSNNTDEQLRKAVCSLLPKLRYLNKQPIKPQRAGEVLTDSVAKAALGSGSWSSGRKATKRARHGGSTFSNAHRNGVAIGKKNRKRLKSRSRHL